jgi:hypothetical protein
MPPKGYKKPNAKKRSVQERSYQARPEQKKNRAARNKARRKAEKEGRARKGDGKDVGHKKALHNGGSRSTSNTKVQSRSSNRAAGAKIRDGKKGKK